MPDFTTLTKAQIAEILSRHVGAKAEVARRASVHPSLVVKWVNGTSVSANVAHFASQVALELLEKERLAKGEANGVSVRAALPTIRHNDISTEE